MGKQFESSGLAEGLARKGLTPIGLLFRGLHFLHGSRLLAMIRYDVVMHVCLLVDGVRDVVGFAAISIMGGPVEVVVGVHL